MNVVSTVSVVPRTIGDINSILTVVFVGQKKFDPKRLGNFFRVWKSKIWNFLLYLKENNKLYHNIALNPFNLDSYPSDDSLPGIQDRVVYDKTSDPDTVFEEETAGISPHPASFSSDSTDQRKFLMENMGISDPESSRLTGRSFTAAALRNLVPKDSSLPDIAVAHGEVVNEYNNPNLFPGMFPSLYPLSIDGFDEIQCQNKISFRAQVSWFSSMFLFPLFILIM